jgi:hypothetical protein
MPNYYFDKVFLQGNPSKGDKPVPGFPHYFTTQVNTSTVRSLKLLHRLDEGLEYFYLPQKTGFGTFPPFTIKMAPNWKDPVEKVLAYSARVTPLTVKEDDVCLNSYGLYSYTNDRLCGRTRYIPGTFDFSHIGRTEQEFMDFLGAHLVIEIPEKGYRKPKTTLKAEIKYLEKRAASYRARMEAREQQCEELKKYLATIT